MISEVQKTFGCKITISTIFENLTVKSLAKAIEQSEQKEEDTLQIKPNLEEAYHPFPLTDVQYAYWLGRSGLYELGNVATHCYFELDADGLDTECAETAWNLLIQRHGMMRVIIQPDGMQRILENTPQYHIDVTDIRQLEVTEKEKALDEKRAEMSHQVIQTDEWPLFDVRITKIEDQKHRIHISFDNIIFDGWSMFHLLNEWAEVYRNGKAEMPITLSFRDYVLGLEQIKSTSAYEKDKKYWEDRVETFADAPDLPLAKNESQITEQRFCRRSAKLSQKEWQSVKDAAGRLEVTPSVLLMSAYAETLRLWSSNKDFTLNLTQFDRKQLHPEVNNLVGDFTTLTLLEIKNAGNNFAERTKAIQKQLTEDLEHTAYGAVELERELKKKTGNMRGAIMPVVFTSGLGVEQWNEGKWLGKLNYNISQTPQVWLDHQVVEMDGCLCLFWDSVDELFYPGMLDEMFRAYTGLLHTLAVHPEIMQEKTASLVTAEISEKRRQANETAAEFEEKTLDGLFLEAADKFPDKEALVTCSRRMTYREIKEEAFYISGQLKSMGIKKEETVAVFMEKGWEQVVAQYISDCKNPSKNQMHSNAGNQTRNSYTVVYIFGDNENEIRDVLIEKLSASNISCKRVGGQEIIERCHEDISVKKKYIIAFSEMASLCITKASELLGENIIINRIFLINPSKAKESDLYLGDISIIDGNSVAIKSWEKAVLGNVREFESNSNDIFDIIMRELENDK